MQCCVTLCRATDDPDTKHFAQAQRLSDNDANQRLLEAERKGKADALCYSKVIDVATCPGLLAASCWRVLLSSAILLLR